MTSPGISISGRGENSCSINSIGKSGSRSCGVNGARVPGCSGGSMGSGNDGRTLTQTSGIWLSRRRNLECSDMGDTTITEGEQASLFRGANPGTDSQFPANCAGNLVSVPGLRRNLVSVPGLRRIATHLPLEHDPGLLGFGFCGVDAGDFQQLFETSQRTMLFAVIQQGAHLRNREA